MGFLFFLSAGHLVSATGTTVWRILKRTGITPAVAVVAVTRRDLCITNNVAQRANLLTILLLPGG
jgi:hypothetical protein